MRVDEARDDRSALSLELVDLADASALPSFSCRIDSELRSFSFTMPATRPSRTTMQTRSVVSSSELA